MNDERRNENSEALKDHSILSSGQDLWGIPKPLMIFIAMATGLVAYVISKTIAIAFAVVSIGAAKKAHKDDPHAFFVWNRVLFRKADHWVAGKGKKWEVIKLKKRRITNENG